MPPDTAEDNREMVPVGRVRRPAGLSGELSITAYAEDPGRFTPGMVLEIAGNEYIVLQSRQGPRGAVLLKLEGVTNPDSADRLRDAEIMASTADLPRQPEGVYYHYQLIGLAVEAVDGNKIGIVTAIMETGGNDVYIVTAEDGNETLIPALAHVVIEINLSAGTMTIDPPPGLIQ